MGLFVKCSGECCVCSCGDSPCAAGNGDDDYSPASKEQVIHRLDRGKYPRYEETMKQYLLNNYSYKYKPLSWRLKHCKLKKITVRIVPQPIQLTPEMKEFYCNILHSKKFFPDININEDEFTEWKEEMLYAGKHTKRLEMQSSPMEDDGQLRQVLSIVEEGGKRH